MYVGAMADYVYCRARLVLKEPAITSGLCRPYRSVRTERTSNNIAVVVPSSAWMHFLTGVVLTSTATARISNIVYTRSRRSNDGFCISILVHHPIAANTNDDNK